MIDKLVTALAESTDKEISDVVECLDVFSHGVEDDAPALALLFAALAATVDRRDDAILVGSVVAATDLDAAVVSAAVTVLRDEELPLSRPILHALWHAIVEAQIEGVEQIDRASQMMRDIDGVPPHWDDAA